MAAHRILPRGSLIRYREDYGASGPGKGLKLAPPEQVADRIIERERGDKLVYGVFDPSAFKEDGGPSIAGAYQHQAYRKAKDATVFVRRIMPVSAVYEGMTVAALWGGWDQMRCQNDWRWRCADHILLSRYLYGLHPRTIPVVLQHDPNRAEDLDTQTEDHAC